MLEAGGMRPVMVMHNTVTTLDESEKIAHTFGGVCSLPHQTEFLNQILKYKCVIMAVDAQV